MPSKPEVDVTQILDHARFGRLQWSATILCALLLMIDGFDNALMSFVAPVIAPLWGVEVSEFGPVFAAGLVGSMVGSFISGLLADRMGRKFMILVSTFVFGVFTLATVRAHSIEDFYVLRFATGLGVGGLIPIAIALSAEYSPKRIRLTLPAVISLGYALGQGLGGFIGAIAIPSFGWQSMFVIGGVVPLMMLPLVGYALPESICFLVARARRADKVAGLLNRLDPKTSFDGTETFVLNEVSLHSFGVRHLFTDGRTFSTVILWLIFVCNMLMMNFLTMWLPTILREKDLPLDTALRFSGILPWAGIFSTLLLGPLVDRLGHGKILTGLYTGAAVFLVILGLPHSNVPVFLLAIIGTGACVVSGQAFLNVMAAVMYPTSIRSTGVGWAIGVGRIGAISGPLLGGLLLAAHFTPSQLFLSIIVPALTAAVAIVVLSRRLHRAPKDRAPEGSLLSIKH